MKKRDPFGHPLFLAKRVKPDMSSAAEEAEVRRINRANRKVIKDFENLLKRRRLKKGYRVGANLEDLEKVKQLLRRVLRKLERF